MARTNLTITLPSDVRQMLTALMGADSRTASSMIEVLIRRGYDAYGRGKRPPPEPKKPEAQK